MNRQKFMIRKESDRTPLPREHWVWRNEKTGNLEVEVTRIDKGNVYYQVVTMGTAFGEEDYFEMSVFLVKLKPKYKKRK